MKRYTIKPSTELPIEADMKKYNIEIIGAGTTKSAAEEFGVENWSTDYHDVVNDPAVDAVGYCNSD